jgi:hypothetical protein
MITEISALAQIDASAWLEDDSPTWQYCDDHAHFAHREACEFMFHLIDEDERFNEWKQEALELGCHPGFVSALEDARRIGAKYVIVYA